MENRKFSLFAPENLREAGFAEVEADVLRIAEKLEELNPALQLHINMKTGLFEVLYENPQTGKTYRTGITCEVLDDRLINRVQLGDLQGQEFGWEQYVKLQQEAEEREQRELDELDRELERDLERRMALASIIHAPRVSMHVSRREKKA